MGAYLGAPPMRDDTGGAAGLCVLAHGLALFAKACDFQLHHITGFKVDWLRLHAHPHARRGSGGDDITRVERHELGQMADNLRDREDHGRCISSLHAFAVHIQRHVQRLRVWNFISGHEIGARGAEGVAAFALGPLPGQLGLEMPL